MMEVDTGGGLWSVMVIAGPIILFAALLFAMLRNRKRSRSEIARSEQATRENYDRQDREDKLNEVH